MSFLFVFLLVSSLSAVTYPSDPYMGGYSPSVSYAPGFRAAFDTTCEGADQFERDECCATQLDVCVEECGGWEGASDDCLDACEESYEACRDASEQSLPLDGGAWVLLLMVAGYAAYQYNKIRCTRLS